jgi:hypothetical protein
VIYVHVQQPVSCICVPCNLCKFHHFRQPPALYLFLYHGDRAMQLLLNHDGDEKPQTVFQLQVSSFIGLSFIALSYTGPPSTASVSPHTPLRNTDAEVLTLYAQSKECQKLHWKVAHKATCTLYTAQPGRNLKESRQKGVDEESQSLGQRLVSCDECVFAHRSGSGEPSMGSP